MKKIRKIISFENPNILLLENLDNKFKEIDYLCWDDTLKFYGTEERLQEVYRFCKAQGLIVKE